MYPDILLSSVDGELEVDPRVTEQYLQLVEDDGPRV